MLATLPHPLADTVGALEGRGGVSPGLPLSRGMVASSGHSSFPSQRAASIGKGFFLLLWGGGRASMPRAPKSMGGAGDALEGRRGGFGGLLLLRGWFASSSNNINLI